MNTKLKSRLIVESSFPGTLALLLEGPEEAGKLISTAQKAFDVRNKKFASIIGGLPGGSYKDVLSKFVKAVDSATDETGGGLEDLADADPDKADDQAASMAGNFDNLNKQVRQILKVNEALMQYLAKQIVKSNLHKGENKDIPMNEILDEAGLLDQAKKEMAAAFDKVGTIGGKPKGFLAKIIAAAFGSTSKVEDMVQSIMDKKDDLIDSILEMTPTEIGSFAQAIVNYGKEDAAASKEIEAAADEAQDEAGSDKVEGTGDDEEETEEGSEGAGASISKKDILSKAKDVAGDAGELVVTKLLDSDFFKDFNITESLHNRSLGILIEKDMSAEDYNALVAAAMEENEGAFEDVDTNSMAKDLNKVFSDSELDFKIEEKPLTWDDLDAKGKRRSQLGFYLDGKYIFGGSPSDDTFDTLLSVADDKGFEAEDIEDMEVDVNNTFIDQDGKGAPKLSSIADLVKLVNKVADANEKYGKFKIGAGEGDEEDSNLQAIKDDSGDYYLVPIENQDRLKKAGFDLEESKRLARLRKLAGIL